MLLALPMTPLVDPYTKSELLEALDTQTREIAAFFRALGPDRFFARPQPGWSPAENVKHLVKANAAIHLGIAVPRAALLVFGRGTGVSRRLGDVRDAYFAQLQAGATAGIYTPLREGADAGDAKARARQNQLVGRWENTNARLARALTAWSEEDLDRYRMPHPIMGRVTVREMCLFALLHAVHHVGKVQARLAGQ